MRIACWITKAADTHSKFVILIVFPLQQRLHESASILRYTYIDCLKLYIMMCPVVLSKPVICVFYITNELQIIQCSLLLSALYMFRAVFLPIVRILQNCMCSLRYCHASLLSTAGVDGLEQLQPIHTSGRQQESMTIPKAAYTVL